MNTSDKWPITPGTRGFLLSSVIGRQVAEGNLRAQVRDTAELFDASIPATSSEVRLLSQSLLRGAKSNVGDLVLALPTLSGLSFGADDLAESIFLVYEVAFRGATATLRLLDHHGRRSSSGSSMGHRRGCPPSPGQGFALLRT